MDRERNYNILRGCVLASGLDNPQKKELINFLTELETHEEYMEEFPEEET